MLIELSFVCLLSISLAFSTLDLEWQGGCSFPCVNKDESLRVRMWGWMLYFQLIHTRNDIHE